jgi:membrane protein implicated in regulation of membrane protease activity
VIIIDILVGLAVLVLIVALVALALSARLMLPVSEWLNGLFRKVGLAGPWRGSRTVGIHGLGTVDGAFAVREGEEVGLGRVYVKGELWNAICPSRLAPSLRDGDTVEIVYNDDLTVTVVQKPPHTVDIHRIPEDSSAPTTDRTKP